MCADRHLVMREHYVPTILFIYGSIFIKPKFVYECLHNYDCFQCLNHLNMFCITVLSIGKGKLTYQFKVIDEEAIIVFRATP